MNELTPSKILSDEIQRQLDLMRVEQAYERFNHLWAMHGPATVGAIYQYAGPRANVMGMDDAEVDRVLRRIQTFFAWGGNHDWIEEWTTAGHEYMSRGNAAWDAGHRMTAGETWRLASVCYFFGWYVHNRLVSIPARDEAQKLCIAAYRKAAPHLVPPSERVEIPFRGHPLPAYMRRPDSGKSDRKWPVVIIWGGANSTKEENHPMTTQFLLRGMATLVFDGPGQNEYLINGGAPLTMALGDAAVQTVVDWLIEDRRVDPDRIGLFGRSGGGITAIHAAATEHRIKCVVAHPASYNWGPRRQLVTDVLTSPLEIGKWLGAKTLADIKTLISQELTLSGGVVGKIRAPMLLINSRQDKAFPPSEAELVKSEATVPTEIVYFDTPGHGGPPSLSWPLAADWIADQLKLNHHDQ